MLRSISIEGDDLSELRGRSPWASRVLALAVLAVFFVALAPLDEASTLETMAAWGSDPRTLMGTGLVTHAFLHLGWLHASLGAGAILLFGSAAESRRGTPALLVAFLGGAIAGALLFGLTASGSVDFTNEGAARDYLPLVGSTGAVAGILGLLLLRDPRVRIEILVGREGAFRVVPAPAAAVGVAWVVADLFLVALGTEERVVPVASALGGLAFGALVAFLRAKALGQDPAPWLAELSAPAGEGPMAPPGPQPAAAAPARAAQVPALDPSPSGRHPAPESAPDGGLSVVGRLDRQAPERAVELPRETAEQVAAAHDLAASIGAVPVEEDAPSVSGNWAVTPELAEVQSRFRQARRKELDPRQAAGVFQYYIKVLGNTALPPGHRAYAAARAARMLLRGKQPARAVELAEKVLAHPLPPEIRAHLAETAEHGRRLLGKKAL